MSACPHHWTVTSECPQCLRALYDGACARVRELEAELHFKACLVHDLLPYQERAVKAEAENEALRALLRTCPYEVNKPQSIADAQWVRDVRAALGDRHD